MSYAFLRFPDFRKKALTLSYDDGVVFDRRLIEILDAYGLKCTFNLNSSTYGKGRHLTKEEAIQLYKNSGHEVAAHGRKHFSLADIPTVQATWEILSDRREHEETYDCLVRGLAYANGSYNERVVNLLKTCDIVYARTVQSTENFSIPTDWLRWNPTCHHDNPRLLELTDAFLDNTPARNFWREEPRLFYLWGHSYEFSDKDNWYIIETFAEKVGNRADVWYATNIEICDYVKAFDSLIFSVDRKRVKNPTGTDLWLCLYGKEVFVPAGKEVQVETI
ncbi:MAG: polysaccharide deacetylase family protein [Clostridia bacterium]|nr:polysaccharide deacetylase family protein [Clostridia bacterium]